MNKKNTTTNVGNANVGNANVVNNKKITTDMLIKQIIAVIKDIEISFEDKPYVIVDIIKPLLSKAEQKKLEKIIANRAATLANPQNANLSAKAPNNMNNMNNMNKQLTNAVANNNPQTGGRKKKTTKRKKKTVKGLKRDKKSIQKKITKAKQTVKKAEKKKKAIKKKC